MHRKARITARTVGVVAGVAIAIVIMLASRVPASDAPLGAAFEVKAGRAAELVVAPAGQMLSARDLQPGSSPSVARVRLRNPTDVTLSVRPAVAGGDRDLDGVLRVRVAAGGRRLYNGPLGGLRRSQARAFEIAAADRHRLSLSAWLPPTARGYEARRAAVALELTTRIVKR